MLLVDVRSGTEHIERSRQRVRVAAVPDRWDPGSEEEVRFGVSVGGAVVVADPLLVGTVALVAEVVHRLAGEQIMREFGRQRAAVTQRDPGGLAVLGGAREHWTQRFLARRPGRMRNVSVGLYLVLDVLRERRQQSGALPLAVGGP